MNKSVRKLFLSFFVSSVVLFSIVNNVLAQVGVGDEDGGRDVTIEIFGPSMFTNLRTYGVYRFAGYITTYILLVVFVLTILYMLFATVKMMQSQGDQNMFSDNLKKIRELLRGLALTFVFLMLYTGVGLALGFGNVFQWPNKLSQCGDGEFLFRAEYRAAVVDENLFDDEVLIYCCKDLELTNIDDTNGEGALNVSTNQGTRDGAVVGDEELGGWLFIADPNGNSRSVVPTNVSKAGRCEPFTI
ncbi:hypothetical protein KC717_05850 [Candidatus Dojkabacteria bacterium]|uniref:Uncharacterized protein n=1 Tax=Candidatus Dojkabacteria bacterium TaxID=2099670 RepID=A0A955L9R7_9BACT|nr:hypothetical protein [Candidatus Dojkabacteria bacterium]